MGIILELFLEFVLPFVLLSSWFFAIASIIVWVLYSTVMHNDTMQWVCIGFTLWFFITLLIPKRFKDI